MKRKSFASALLALYISALFGIAVVVPLRAAPSKNQSAAVYLKNASQTHWSTQALYVLAEENIPADHLKSATCSSAIACAGPILGITALGEDPRSFAAEDLVAKLMSFSHNNQLGDTATLNDDMFGILALLAAGVNPSDATVSASKTFLLQNQNSDGGFGWMVGGSDVDDTAAAVMALLETGISKTDAAIHNAVSYIKKSQNTDGGFPYDPVSPWGTNSNANTTAWVVSMVYKLGEDPESADWSKDKDGKNPVAFLNSLQTAEGWFEYEKGAGNALPVDTTAQVAIALAGASYPVRKITYTPPPPPPPPAGMIIPPSFSSAPPPPEGVNQNISAPEVMDKNNEIKQEETVIESEKEKTEERGVPAVVGQKLVAPFSDGTLVKTPNDPTVYMMENGRKRWVPNETILRLRFPSPRVIEFVDAQMLSAYPEGLEVPYPDGVYLTGETTRKVYLISRGKKYHVRSGDAWARIRTRADVVVVSVPDRELVKYETGGVVE